MSNHVERLRVTLNGKVTRSKIAVDDQAELHFSMKAGERITGNVEVKRGDHWSTVTGAFDWTGAFCQKTATSKQTNSPSSSSTSSSSSTRGVTSTTSSGVMSLESSPAVAPVVPTDELAYTGLNVWAYLVIIAALFAAGVSLYWLRRRGQH
jgi:hypothetical protein